MQVTSENFATLLADGFKNPQVIENLQSALTPIVTALVEKEVQRAVEGFQLEIDVIRKAQEQEKLALLEKIKHLEDEKDRALQYSFKEDLIIEGMPLPSHSTNNKHESSETLAKAFVALAKTDLGIDLLDRDISSVHPLPQGASNAKQRGDKPRSRLLVRFISHRIKQAVYRARLNLNKPENRRKYSGSPIFINEHLTPSRAKLFQQARQMKANKEVQNCWTNDGKVFVLKNSAVRLLT